MRASALGFLLFLKFQFYKSAIKSVMTHVKLFCIMSFNSTKVRLKAESASQGVRNKQEFQFYKSAIKREHKLWILSFHSCFNSTKVRLKVGEKFSRSMCWMFQFYKSAIKSFSHFSLIYYISMFQFYKSAIKSFELRIARL